MQFSDEISVAEAFPEYLQNIKVIHASKPADVSEDDSRMRIAVECSSVEILERLWNDYCSGYLNVVAEKCLVTDDIKERFQVERVNLQTTILEEDYLACKEFLLAKTRKLNCLEDGSFLFMEMACYYRPFPSCFEPHYVSETKCKVYIMKISFHSYANKLIFM